MTDLLTSLDQAKHEEELDQPITGRQLRSILSNVPLAQIIQQSNMTAQKLNDIGFRFNVLIEYLLVHGLQKGPDTRYRLDGARWTRFFQDKVKEQHAAVEKAQADALKKQADAAGRPV